MALENQIENYIFYMRSNEEFLELNGINQKFSRDKEEYCILIKNLVETKKNIVYPLVYLLIKLSLILSITSLQLRLWKEIFLQ